MKIVLPCGKKTVIQSLMCWWSSEPNVVCKSVFPHRCTRRQKKRTYLCLGLFQTQGRDSRTLEQRLEEKG